MNNADMTELITAMDDWKVTELLALFTDVTLTVNHLPRTGLMMLTVRDSFDTAFHLGEVLVTEARVLYHDHEGFGMVLGEAPHRALARAATDAVFRCPDTIEIKVHLGAFFKKEKLLQLAKQAEQAAMVAATKVNFDLMPGA
jgi:alpha-D-ribose 1-methylphosphonate 5-triphosphate synthase subunit PhnG